MSSLLQLKSPGPYRVMYLNTNARALPPTEASTLFETIATNLKEACRITVRDVVSHTLVQESCPKA